MRERTDDLEGKTIGIVGLGRIGREVAQRALSFDMAVLAYDPYVAAAVAQQVSAGLVPLDELMASANVITVHAVSTPETAALINGRNLALVRPGSYFLNFARGALIENLDILYEALMDGRLAGVGLDVFPQEPPLDLAHPLFRYPNFIGSPHVLASTEGAEKRCHRSMCRDIRAVLEGRRPEWCVNPDVFDSPQLRRYQK